MKMNIEQIPPYRIAFIRHTGPYGAGNVQTMEKLKSWAKSNDFVSQGSYPAGNSAGQSRTTRRENCRYDTCLVISADYCLRDETIHQGTLEGGCYAVFQIEHTAEALQEAWAGIFPELSSHGCRFDESRPVLERYRMELVLKPFLCEICVPIFDTKKPRRRFSIL
jgi:DNA gyrase inhibitor GyrI